MEKLNLCAFLVLVLAPNWELGWEPDLFHGCSLVTVHVTIALAASKSNCVLKELILRRQASVLKFSLCRKGRGIAQFFPPFQFLEYR